MVVLEPVFIGGFEDKTPVYLAGQVPLTIEGEKVRQQIDGFAVCNCSFDTPGKLSRLVFVRRFWVGEATRPGEIVRQRAAVHPESKRLA